MKKNFGSVYGIFMLFFQIRYQSEGRSWPTERRFKADVQCERPYTMLPIHDEKAFVGDINLFLHHRLQWYERIIIEGRMDPVRHRTYGELVYDIKREAEKREKNHQDCIIGRRLDFRQQVRREFWRIEEKAEKWFVEAGYLTPDESPFQDACI